MYILSCPFTKNSHKNTSLFGPHQERTRSKLIYLESSQCWFLSCEIELPMKSHVVPSSIWITIQYSRHCQSQGRAAHIRKGADACLVLYWHVATGLGKFDVTEIWQKSSPELLWWLLPIAKKVALDLSWCIKGHLNKINKILFIDMNWVKILLNAYLSFEISRKYLSVLAEIIPVMNMDSHSGVSDMHNSTYVTI